MHARVLSVICVFLATATGYTYYPATESYYKFHNIKLSWDVAYATCARESAYLLVVNDAEEADIVAGIVKNATHGYYTTWTGLRDNRPGGVMEWRTIHGQPLSDVFHEWGFRHPYNDTRRTCAGFGPYNKQLYDDTHYFICEKSQ